jgi:hypothetical protein
MILMSRDILDQLQSLPLAKSEYTITDAASMILRGIGFTECTHIDIVISDSSKISQSIIQNSKVFRVIDEDKCFEDIPVDIHEGYRIETAQSLYQRYIHYFDKLNGKQIKQTLGHPDYDVDMYLEFEIWRGRLKHYIDMQNGKYDSNMKLYTEISNYLEDKFIGAATDKDRKAIVKKYINYFGVKEITIDDICEIFYIRKDTVSQVLKSIGVEL